MSVSDAVYEGEARSHLQASAHYESLEERKGVRKMLFRCWAALLVLWIALPAAAEPGNLLAGGDFEQGIGPWTTGHAWYEAGGPGKGGGLSAWSIDSGAARSGKQSLKVAGQKNRGIAMQILALPPDIYRISGWVKTENMGDARAQILAEFLDKSGKWLSGVPAGEASGTQDWTLVSKEITVPVNARQIHLDLLTDRPNEGTAWFDDIRIAPLAGRAQPPAPVRFEINRKPMNRGQLHISWQAHRAEPGVARYDIYAESKPFSSLKNLKPKASVPWDEREAAIASLKEGARYWVVVAAVGTGGRTRQQVKPLQATVRDRRAPDAVRIGEAVLLSGSRGMQRLRFRWQPNPMDDDIERFQGWLLPQPVSRPPLRLAKTFPAGFRSHSLAIKKPARFAYLGLAAMDKSGNRGRVAWQRLDDPEAIPVIASGPDSPQAVRVWVTSPLSNVFKDTPAPGRIENRIDLVIGRNETECAQIVVSSGSPIRRLSAVAGELRHTDGSSLSALPEMWFIGYIHVAKNSTATPPEELLRAAPADFPDPFLEQRQVAVKAGANQPIFYSIRVPKKAKPGLYTGRVWLLTDRGRLQVPVRLEVLPVDLPDRMPLYVTNWFNVNNLAVHHRVPLWSEDFWKLLRLYAREMNRGHQNVVLTPLDLVKIYREANGRLSFDFRDFDRWVRLFEGEGVARRIELSHLGGRTTGEWDCPTFTIYPRPAIDRKSGQNITVEIEPFLPALEKHLAERGWLAKTLLHIGDEPIMGNVASWREQSARAHRAAPRLKRIDAIHVPFAEVKGYIEVTVPQLNYYDQWHDSFRQAKERGEAESWFYIAWVPQGKYMNRLIDYPAIKTRLIHWVNFLRGATGYLHWGLNFWTDFKEMGFAPGDNWILYPGADGPRSCLRWEAMRDGLEDYAHLRLLASLGASGRARAGALGRSIVRAATDYDRDPERLETVRRRILREIARLQR
ncbi:MAG: DUF4091 domain-containing protein [Armatimonadetes bacterium]|nr:DUF4091 domain-containing protein [Armatimonadota bacterium]